MRITRRFLGLTLLAMGIVLLALVTIVGTRDRGNAGDAATIESALRPTTTAAPQPVTASEAPTTIAAPQQLEEIEESVTSPPATVPVVEPLPVGLRIDALEVDAPVVPYGVDESGQMDVPDNVTDIAWYEFGPRPGQAGSAVLAAHVDLESQGPGVFFDLKTLEEGDRVTVVNDDGTEESFIVFARVVYDKDELPLDVIFSREGPSVLTLITCGGGFNSRLSSYDSNVVVYAIPADASIASVPAL
ncbi:MAG: class F sortase [Acidimicrobiia bacterium]|nr:class F sortase [Acidimicrobiia bacterium]